MNFFCEFYIILNFSQYTLKICSFTLDFIIKLQNLLASGYKNIKSFKLTTVFLWYSSVV